MRPKRRVWLKNLLSIGWDLTTKRTIFRIDFQDHQGNLSSKRL